VSDPRQIRALLGTAPGYAVIDRRGKRIGAYVELAGGDRIVIRHDGTFVWHQRLLPITTVAAVLPDKRAVVLTIDERALTDTGTPPEPEARTSANTEEGPDPTDDWQDRISRYVAPVNGDPPQGELTRDGAPSEPSPHAEDARASARQPDQPEPEPEPEPKQDRGDKHTAERHLLFISTSAGYSLVEREGPPPPLGGHIELPGQAIPLVVLKLSRSPLPNDDRMCAHVQPTA
jgi:hypothetical protein